jgi:organic radical activating enzyme
MEVAISELFFSIQGEGPNCGMPAVFIRFHGCQLRCPWCDTAYALDPDDPHSRLNIDDMISGISQWPCRHVVITGGDPTFQMEALDELTSVLLENGYTMEIETSGVKLIPKSICGRISLINVGLKLPNAVQPFSDQYFINTIEHYQPMKNAVFKIVVTDAADVDFIANHLVDRLRMQPDKVLLMPLGNTIEEQNRHSGFVIEACKREGFRFSPRLHIIFGLK